MSVSEDEAGVTIIGVECAVLTSTPVWCDWLCVPKSKQQNSSKRKVHRNCPVCRVILLTGNQKLKTAARAPVDYRNFALLARALRSPLLRPSPLEIPVPPEQVYLDLATWQEGVCVAKRPVRFIF